MNLDDLANSIPDSEVTLRENLKQHIDWWKNSDQTIEQLGDMLSKWHGNVWFKNRATSDKFYADILSFKKHAIYAINGMTVNERLYWFSLFDLWDKSDSTLQSRIREKIHARA